MLHLVISDARGQRPVVVSLPRFTIGRGGDNHLQLSDVQVSRQHAELVWEGSVWRIRDRGSRFGTFVNDKQIEDVQIAPGDRIRIGQTDIRVEPDESAALNAAPFEFRQMNALLAGLCALGSGRVLDEVLTIVLDSALEVTGAERALILLADDSGRLSLRLARVQGQITLTSVQTSQRIPEKVFATGTNQIVTDLQEGLHASEHAGTVALGIRHVLCTPLKVAQYGAAGERRIGVLYFDSRERGYLQTISALHALAAEAAVVIENARLYQEMVEKERVAQELRIAADMQRALLPASHCEAHHAEVAAIATPCRDVGGDLFDYSVRGNQSLAFVVADVAGKGTSAALLTAVVQGLFAAEAEATDAPGTIVTRMNRGLCRRPVESRFVTAFFGNLSASGELRYCNAGHNAPFLLTASGIARLDRGGAVLGLFNDESYETGTARMTSGDLLVVFSDGLTEAMDANGVEFGEERVETCLRDLRGQRATTVVDQLRSAVGTFVGAEAARDDMTVLVVRAH